MLAGKRNANVLSAILQQMSIARKSVADSDTEAVGSMDKQLEVYNQSIQASIDRFKVAFQELSADIFKSDFLKGLIDAGTNIIKFIDEVIKKIGVVGTALTGLGIYKVISTLSTGAKTVDGLSTAISTIGKYFLRAGVSAEEYAKALGVVESASGGAINVLGALGKSALGFITSPAGIVAGITAVIAAIYQYKKAKDEALNTQASEATDIWNTSKTDTEDYIKRYKELNEQLNKSNLSESERISIKQQLLSLQNEINNKYGNQSGHIDLVNGKLETQLKILSNITTEQAKQNLRDNEDTYSVARKAMTKNRTFKVQGANTSKMSEEVAEQYGEIFAKANFSQVGNKFVFSGDATQFNDAVNEVLDGLEDLQDEASETDKYLVQNSIDSAKRAMKENKKTLDEYADNYKAYLEQKLYDDGFGDELVGYAKKVQEYNDALASGKVNDVIDKRNEMLDYYSNNIKNILSTHGEYAEFFGNVDDQVDQSTEKIMEWKEIVETGTADANNHFAKSADFIRGTINAIKKLGYDGIDIQAMLANDNGLFAGSLRDLAELFNPDMDFKSDTDLASFMDFLEMIGALPEEVGEGIDLASADFKTFILMASNVIDTVDKVNSALVNAFASGGMSARIDEKTGELTGDVAEIINAYKNLDGFDVENIFERTAKGIGVNRDALRELQAEQEKATKEEFGKRIIEAYSNYQKALDDGDFAQAKEWKTLYDNVRLLAGAYDGATSAYQKWLDAQKMGEAGDMYDTIAKTALERGNELYEAGLVGTNEFRAIAQLYSDLDLSTASVDEITEAYEKGYETVKKYFTEGQDGAVAFADKLVALGHATKDSEGNYDFFNGIDTQELAHELGISVDLVEAAFNKLGDYGFDIHFTFNDATTALEQFRQRVEALSADGIDIDIENDDQLREIAEYLLSLDEDEIKPIIDLQGADTVEEVVELLTQKYTIQADVSSDTSAVPSDMSTTVKANVQLDDSNLNVEPQTVPVTAEPSPLPVELEPNDEKVQKYTAEAKPAEVVYDVNDDKPKNYRPPNKDANANYWVKIKDEYKLDNISGDRNYNITYHINTVGSAPMARGTVSYSAFQGLSHARGTAHGGGLAKYGLKHNENALINELGAEIVVRPSEDAWMIFNGGKPTMGAPLKKGDIIFPADQSKKLLQRGWADDYGKIIGGSFANGTVKGNAHAGVTGGGKFKKAVTKSDTKKDKSGGGGGGGGNNNSTKDAKEFEEVLDEIEIKIDRIERAIGNLDTVASNTFNSLASRQNALKSEISRTTEEIEIQRQGYARYMKEAEKFTKGVDPQLLAEVRSGKIDIKTIKDEDLWKKLDSYKKYFELAISCRDAVYELQATEADFWIQRFDLAQTDYENKIAQYQHMYDLMDSYIEEAENKGMITTNKYRQKQITEETKKIAQLEKEYTGLKNKMVDALKAGMAVGSEEYYQMLGELNAIQESIAETNANISELNKSIQETNWKIFDKVAESIAGMKDELEFVYDLLGDEEKFFDDKGIINSNGIAGFGILASQYNVSASEAKRYAKEIENIKKELEADSDNQDLIDRQNDLYESWRKAISSANDYKEAIRDLVETGIKAQIDSLKDLISEYTDLIDTQKDEIDYAKRVSNAQENINKIQKQLNAYANDDSEEGATRRQRLRNELKSAQENLAQTQEERRISQTKKLLSDLQDEYEEVLNARLDDLEALVQSVVNGVDANASTIASAINTATSSVGYTMTDSLNTIFTGDHSLVAYFTNGDFVGKVTNIATAVNRIETYFKNAETHANTAESTKVNEAITNQNSLISELASAGKTGTKAKNTANKTTGLDGSWNVNSNKQRVGWTFNDGTKATGWSQIDKQWYYFGDDGKMKAGLQTIGKNKYYIRRYGGRATKEWVQIGSKWYYFDQQGKAVTDWQALTRNGKKSWFYFDPNTAALMTNSWIKNSSKKGTYYVDAEGRMLMNGKFKTKDGYRTFDKYGKWKGYKSGIKSVGADGLYWTNEGAPETIIRKSDGAVLTKLNSGDSVLNNKATTNMWDFANNPQKFLKGMGINSTGNDVDLVINLNGLKSPSEFMVALRKDKNFERFIQEITIGRVSGHGSLSKNSIAL